MTTGLAEPALVELPPYPRGLSESTLFRSLGAGARRSEPCCCGGPAIVVDEANDPVEVARAVDSHNEATTHQRWRAWREEIS